MNNKKLLSWWCIIILILSDLAYAQPPDNGIGQTLQINTRLHSFVGRPAWLIIIRDVDHGENIPYLYDFDRGRNFWLALTRGRNYLITASIMSFSPYSNKPWRTRKIHNFCNLESHGHIIRAKSMVISLEGHLSPNPAGYRCTVQVYADAVFTIVPNALIVPDVVLP